jgi:hypothetical protein
LIFDFFSSAVRKRRQESLPDASLEAPSVFQCETSFTFRQVLRRAALPALKPAPCLAACDLTA